MKSPATNITSNIISTLLVAVALLTTQSATAFAPASGSVVRTNVHNRGILGHHSVPSQLHLSEASQDDDNQGPFNLSLFLQTAANQALIGWTIWTPNGLGAQVLAHDTKWSALAIVAGILGVVPMIWASRKVETSESPAFADLNLSTNLLMLRYFGDEPQPVVAFGVSAVLSGLTGVVEEVIFRGQLVPQCSKWALEHNVPFAFGDGIFAGAVLSTVLFAALHVNPIGLTQGKEAARDCVVLLLYQICTGATFCTLYIASGYNLVVPIITHALYDFYTFYWTHLQVTGQMQYAKAEQLLPRMPAIEAKWNKQRGEKFVQDLKECFYLADTNKDGVLSREELRIAMYSYGIRLSSAESAKIAESADTDASGAIDFGEYMEFIGPEGSRARAIKRSLLGIN